MKTKIIFLVLIIITLTFLHVKNIMGQSGTIYINKFCELRGGQLAAFGDGFSALDTCPKNSRVVAINQPAALKIFDSSIPEQELGIYVEPYKFFYPPLNAFVSINEESKELGWQTRIFYTNSECTLNPRIEIEESDPLKKNSAVVISGGTKFFMITSIEENNNNFPNNYYLQQGEICLLIELEDNFPQPSSYANLEEVNFSLKSPVEPPLIYRYQ